MWNLYDPLIRQNKAFKHCGVKTDVLHERPSTVDQMFFMLENVGKLGSKSKRFGQNPEDRMRYI